VRKQLLNRRVVITGIGVVSPLGNTTEETWAGLLAGRSGVDTIQRFDTKDHTVRFAAETKNFEPTKFVEKKELKKMDYYIFFAIAAALEALSDSGLKISDDNAEFIGTYIGSGIGGFGVFEREHAKMLNGGPGRISPFFIPASIINLRGRICFDLHRSQGTELSYGDRLQFGCSRHRRQLQDHRARRRARAMICGGSEGAITPMSVGGSQPCAHSRPATMIRAALRDRLIATAMACHRRRCGNIGPLKSMSTPSRAVRGSMRKWSDMA
jgi:3-oxoacyl-[acyl-carrier-protein] synthase II